MVANINAIIWLHKFFVKYFFPKRKCLDLRGDMITSKWRKSMSDKRLYKAVCVSLKETPA